MGRNLNPFETVPRVFLSYARSDGEQIARELRTRLERDHPEITLWLDRAQMVAGLGWWKQITEALERVEILVMVLTPNAMHSEIAAKEWRYARQQGVRVCPVTFDAPALDFAALPGWIRKAHCYDLSREWDTFVSYLQSPGKDNRVPYMAPDLPDNCVQRPVEFHALLGRLLDSSGENPLAVTTALQGAGGFGKTTLACMLCHHPGILSAFDDGILWVTLGEAPNVQGELTKLYAALTGERPPFIDIDDASIQLATRLDQKNCLLVIDDVWDPNHLQPFMRGAAACARLVTTRQLSVVGDAGIERTPIDRMTAAEAVQLLAARMPASPGNSGALHALAERLGCWPLLLKLAGSQLRERMERGESLADALAYMERAMNKRGVVAFDRAGRSARGDAVASTVAASLELFSPADRIRCAELAVFRGNAVFPLTAVSVLWDLDDFDAEALLLRLDDAALLEFDLRTASVRLHAVLKSYFETRLDAAHRLHARLTERWLRNPGALPDTYAWTWIGWHLAMAQQLQRLEHLLLDFDWLKARLRATPVQITLQDCDLINDCADIKVLRSALLLAINGLSFDPGQLRSQLLGRLDRGASAAIDRLLDQADRSEPVPRLTLSDASLTHPGGALAAILKSHSAAVETLAISPDGRWIVSGSQDWTLRLWDLETNSVVRTFEGTQGTVHAVVFTADGQAILSGSEDRLLRLWDAATGQVRQIFSGHTLGVLGVTLGPGGLFAYSASEDGTVREWNLRERRSRTLFRGNGHHQLGPLVVTADGRQLLFGAGDDTICIMDLAAGNIVRTLEGHSGIVRALALSADGSMLLSGGDDGVVRAWAPDTGKCLLEFRGHAGPVGAVAFTDDGRRAISGSQDRTLRLWSLETGAQLRVLNGHSGYVRAIALSTKTGQVVSGSTDGTVRLWNIDTGCTDESLDGHGEAVWLLALAAQGGRAVSGSRGSELLLWGAVDGGGHAPQSADPARPSAMRICGRLEGHAGRIHAIELSADGRFAVSASRDHTLRIWDLEQACSTHVLKGHTREVLDLQLSADGRSLVSWSRDRTARLWDVQSGRAMRALVADDNERALAALDAGSALIAELGAGPTVDVSAKSMFYDTCVAISPDGHTVVLGSHGTVCLWDARTGAMRHQPLGDFDTVAIEFAPDSGRVILGSLFGSLLMWQFGTEPKLLEGHSGRVLDVVVTPDGRRAVSAATDDTIRIWDLGAGRPARQLQGCVGRADAVAVAPHGNFAYAVYGHAVVAYDLNAGARLGSLSLDHQITAISVVPSGTQLALGDLSGRVHHLALQV
jgi:WD40 repeat protein